MGSIFRNEEAQRFHFYPSEMKARGDGSVFKTRKPRGFGGGDVEIKLESAKDVFVNIELTAKKAGWFSWHRLPWRVARNGTRLGSRSRLFSG